ncbi:MAG: hypothetical protein CMC13_01190 [Flavobacteriaceae bacterium]|nr:hypothetical protein [Flavobacteriaceae bacterium]|tara:strand:+ start:1901 stop:2398 length:498 start_codon:yes stop_codon:yes gene_type:complete
MRNQILAMLMFFGMIATIGSANNLSTEKKYQKTFYDTGILKAEGWQIGTVKTDYWYFYHANGQVASKGTFRSNQKEGYWFYYNEEGHLLKEGHYKHGMASGWWIFYDIATHSEKRFQYNQNQKNGYALIYKNNRLRRAEKYHNNTKIGEWTSIFSFKRDNPDVSL